MTLHGNSSVCSCLQEVGSNRNADTVPRFSFGKFRRWRSEDLLAVQDDIESLALLLFRNPQADQGLGDHQ